MRLPRGKRLGVQSLGREDINAPSREWAAKANARNAMVGAIQDTIRIVGDIYEKQDDNANQLKYREQVRDDKAAMEEARTFMANTNVVDLEDFKGPEGIREFLEANPGMYRDEPGGSTAKTHSFMLDYTKYQAEELNKASMEVLQGTKYQSNYVADMTSTVVGSIQGLGTAKAKQAQAANSAKADILYQDAVNALDENSAMEMITTNMANGTWNPEQGLAKQMQLGQDIDYTQASRMAMSNDPSDLTDAMDFVYGQPNRMSISQRLQLGSKIDNKQRQLTAQHEADLKTAKTERSAEERLGLEEYLHVHGHQSMDKLTMMVRGASIDPAEARAVYALNRSMRGTASAMKSNPGSENYLNGRIYSLATPEAGATYADQKRSVLNQITEAVQRGPANGGITGGDAMSMRKQVDEMADIGVKNTQYRDAEDAIYKTMTGASKDSMGMFDDTAVSVIAALEMDRALFEASRQQGDEFDARTWVDQNMNKYAIQAYRTNMQTYREEMAVNPHAIAIRRSEPGAGGSSYQAIDLDATRVFLREQLATGAMDKKTANSVIEAIKEMDRLERAIQETGGM